MTEPTFVRAVERAARKARDVEWQAAVAHWCKRHNVDVFECGGEAMMPPNDLPGVLNSALILLEQAARKQRDKEWAAAVLDQDEVGGEDWISCKAADPTFARVFLRELFKDRVEAARDAQREEDCKAVCLYCRENGAPVHSTKWGWIHKELDGTHFQWLPCKAAAIREGGEDD